MKKKILFDIKAWLVVILFLPLINQGATLQETAVAALVNCGLVITLFYPHQWLLKQYLREKKWLLYSLGLLVLIVGVTGILSFFSTQNGETIKQSFLSQCATTAVVLIFSTTISYAYKGIILQIQYEKTKRRQVEAELKLLQSQVNPHFLFNTLNNIYAQNLVNQEEANDMILQLADLMRYQIESSKKNEVSIDDEIDFLENYIALEKKRSTDRIKVSFAVDKANNLTLNIPPMLFIPFIENAYKHGINTEGSCSINILLVIKAESISFRVDNPIPVRKQIVKSTKTGLDNIKKRLDLLFPNRHQLAISTENYIYHVQLDIQI